MVMPNGNLFGIAAKAGVMEEKVIDVTKFGADLTGATDSTEAVKKAIVAAKEEAALNGRVIRVHTRKNRFIIDPRTSRKEDKAATILVEPTNKVVNGTIHKNMKIHDNVFYMLQSRPVLDAKCVENLTFENNKVYRQEPEIYVEVSLEKNEFAFGEKVEIDMSSVEENTLYESRLYQFNGCKEVKIKNNIYDSGLNAGISKSGDMVEEVIP